MAAESNTAVQTEEQPKNLAYRDRRYVGTKETVAYLLNDFSELADLII